MFCNKCGTELNDDSLFCSKCGAQVGTVKRIDGNVTLWQDIKQFFKNHPSIKLTLIIIVTIPFAYLFLVSLALIVGGIYETIRKEEFQALMILGGIFSSFISGFVLRMLLRKKKKK